jgi:O-antigen ligase
MSLIYKPFLQNNNKRLISLALFISIIFGFIGTQTNTNKRISQAVTEIQQWYYYGDESDTSSGLRAQMWVSGLRAAKQSPWFGYGYRNANKAASEYATNNKNTISSKTHLHSEYLTSLVSAGVIGLLALLVLLFKPITIFYKKLNNPDTYYYSLMGIILCVGYATFGFTHIAFGEEHVNAFYILFMGFLLPKVAQNN